MKTFTYRHRDDTLLERDGSAIRFTFWPDTFTFNAPDTMEFNLSQSELYQWISDYMETGKHAETFDELTILGQNALFEALHWMAERSVTV